MPGELGSKRNETEAMPDHAVAANQAIALWLHSTLLVGRVVRPILVGGTCRTFQRN